MTLQLAPRPEEHPLISRLCTQFGASRVTADGLADWMARPGAQALLLAGDPVRFPEGLDVAVVLPEVRAACGQPFDIAVVPRAEEDAVARRLGSQRWPTVVFARDGQYLDSVSGMQDWDDYVAAVRAALAAPARRWPGVGIPVVMQGGGAGASACSAAA